MDYLKVLPYVISKYRNKGNFRFKFEKYDSMLPLKAFVIASLCVSKSRPNNRTIIDLAWPVIRSNYKQASKYAASWFQGKSLTSYSIYDTEEHQLKMSRQTRMKNNGRFRGTVVAIDIDSAKPLFLYGPKDFESFGFNPDYVYEILNKRNRFIHHGHIFVRSREVFDNGYITN